jgi:hypothetical protein
LKPQGFKDPPLAEMLNSPRSGILIFKNMVKKIFSRDVKYSKAKYSPWAKDLLSGKAGKAANLPIEKKKLYGYFKQSLGEAKGNTTLAIAKTMGYLKKDSEFNTQEVFQIKAGLKEKGYTVPGYSIKPVEKMASETGFKKPSNNRSRIEEIAARGSEVKREVGKEIGRYFSSSKAAKKSTASSFFSSRPRF